MTLLGLTSSVLLFGPGVPGTPEVKGSHFLQLLTVPGPSTLLGL
jgi:hypothetical protein